jgi:hypothetical protein
LIAGIDRFVAQSRRPPWQSQCSGRTEAALLSDTATAREGPEFRRLNMSGAMFRTFSTCMAALFVSSMLVTAATSLSGIF